MHYLVKHITYHILIFMTSHPKTKFEKFQIELGIHHQELGIKWDEPVPEEMAISSRIQ